jgi:ATP-dependent Clp protease protease subunit
MHDVILPLACLSLFAHGRRTQTSHPEAWLEQRKVNDALATWLRSTEEKQLGERSGALASLLLAAPPSSRGSVALGRSGGVRRAAEAEMAKETPRVPYKQPGSNNQYTTWISVYDRMAYERIITMFGYLDNDAANQYIAFLLYLKQEDAKKKVTLYFNLLGGDLAAGLALRDAMSTMPFEIETVNVGVCSDIGAYLASSGTKGKRLAMPSSKFRLAGPRMYPPTDREGKPVQVPMQASDIKVEVEQVLRDKQLILEGFSKYTGQSIEKLEEDFKRDFYLTAEEAVEYGLVDEIIKTKF